MKRFAVPLLALTVALALVAFVGPAAAARLDGADHGGRPLTTTLLGANEVPGPGDPDGIGSATITLNLGQGEVCFELSVSGIAPATAAHIHVAPVGVAGPVVVPLTPPTSGFSSGCRSVDRDLIKAILQNPEAYYVNVHNAEYPAGALRGQLSK
jgi:hypothetical protein